MNSNITFNKSLKASLVLCMIASTDVQASAGSSVFVCDGAVIEAQGEKPLRVLSHRSQSAAVVDAGRQFSVVVGSLSYISPPLKDLAPGIMSADSPQGAIFVKRGDTYQISLDGGVQWLFFDQCLPAA